VEDIGAEGDEWWERGVGGWEGDLEAEDCGGIWTWIVVTFEFVELE